MDSSLPKKTGDFDRQGWNWV